MKRLFRSMFSSGNAELKKKAQATDEQINKVNESFTAFMSAAGDTLSLAQDVTVGLRDRIDDYTNQIEATSLVIPDALILVSEEGKLENINAAAERIFGFCKSEFLQKTIGDLFLDYNGGVTIDTIQTTFQDTTNSFDLVRKGKLTIRGIKKNGVQFYPNIKISEFARSDGTNKFMLLVQDITENVLAEQRFINMFDQQTATLKAIPDILIIVDSQMKIRQVINSSVYDSFIVEDHTNSNLSELLSPDNLALFKSKYELINPSNPLETWSFQVDNDNGSSTYYEARASLCGDHVLVVMRDETDVVITREELLESEEHFRVFGQASNEAMMIHDEQGLLDWNPRLGEMTGFTNSEISKMKADDFIHPMERARIGSSETEASKAYTTLFCTKTGNSVEVAINERFVEWKGENARIKVIRDITHLKDVEQILHMSRERYKSITDNTFDVVACYGKDLGLTFVNQTFLDYFGKPFEPNTSLLEAIDIRDHQRVLSHLTEITSDAPVKRTLHRVSYYGETRWLDWIDRAVFDDNGEFLEFQGIGRDVTDYIKRAKEISR